MDNRLSKKRLFLPDLDGTLYLDGRLFDGAADFLAHVRAKGGRYLFLTNNSSRSADAYVDKMAALGIASAAGDFLTSTDALILDLKRSCPGGFFYAFGTRSFVSQLRGAGLHVTTRLEDGIDTLLCGFDTELTFQKLEDACILLGRGARFVATNPDWVCPTRYGFVPDCGSVCEMLWHATGRRPRVIGKPQPDMARLAMERTGFRPDETLLVGDRIYTDIACGIAAGIDTALVLSGETTEKMLLESPQKPTFVFPDILQLLLSLKGT